MGFVISKRESLTQAQRQRARQSLDGLGRPAQEIHSGRSKYPPKKLMPCFREPVRKFRVETRVSCSADFHVSDRLDRFLQVLYQAYSVLRTWTGYEHTLLNSRYSQSNGARENHGYSYFIFANDLKVQWCSGYHVSFTRHAINAYKPEKVAGSIPAWIICLFAAVYYYLQRCPSSFYTVLNPTSSPTM